MPILRLRALIAAAKGDVAAALGYLRSALETSEQWIATARASLTETQMGSALDYLRVDEELVYSLAADHPDDPKARSLAMTYATLRKGRLAGEVTKTYGVFEHGGGAAELANLRADYATASLLGAPVAELAALETRANDVELGLVKSHAIAQIGAGTMDASTNPDLVMGRLGMAAAMGNLLVDYEEFRHFRFTGPNIGFGDPEYIAFLLQSGHLAAVPLGAASRLDAAARSFVAAAAKEGAPYRPAASAAHDAILGPVLAKIEKGEVDFVDRALYISPDGELGLVPFAALEDSGGQPMLERYRISYLDTPRDVWSNRRSAEQASNVEVFAAPDFATSLPGGQKKGATSCGSLDIASIPPLPGTVEEAAALKKLIPLAQVHSGADASKSALLAAMPGILHVATHGLFMTTAEAARNTRGMSLEVPKADAPEPAALRGNPLVRSSLILSGSGGLGGFATALEIGGMNLEATQLVVLSACDTGRGDVHVGQGIYGLRRAFALAGARTVVTSLWKVDDDATRELMTHYYRGLLDGEGKADAMRRAARELRQKNPHPYYWAPFVVSGDNGGLVGKSGAAIPVIERKRGIEVHPTAPVQPIILGPH